MPKTYYIVDHQSGWTFYGGKRKVTLYKTKKTAMVHKAEYGAKVYEVVMTEVLDGNQTSVS